MNADIQAVQVHLKEAQEKVALGKCLERLTKNRDFRKLIEQKFFKDEPARLVMLRGCPDQQSESAQLEINNDMIAIAGLFQFFCCVNGEARAMEHAIEADKQMVNDLEDAEANEAAQGDM